MDCEAGSRCNRGGNQKGSDRTITDEAIGSLRDCSVEMQPLPSWGSARDVFDTILPALYSQCAKRLVTMSKAQVVAGIEPDASTKTPPTKASARKSVEDNAGPPPYEVEDVELALRPIVANRMKAAGYEDH